MTRQTKIINMSIPQDLYSSLDKIARQRGTSRSQILKEALKNYIDEEIRWQQIRKWGKETATKLGIKNEDDVERIREEYWEEQNRKSLDK